MPELKDLHVKVTPEYNEAFDTLADQTGMSKSEVVRRALKAYFISWGIRVIDNVPGPGPRGGKREPGEGA